MPSEKPIEPPSTEAELHVVILVAQLEKAMKDRNMTKLDVALALRVHPSQITKWLSLRSNMTLTNLNRFAAAVGLKVKLCPIST